MTTITRPLRFEFQGRRKRATTAPVPLALAGGGGDGLDASGATPGRVPRVAKLMALAIKFDGLLRDGTVSSQTELAALAHVTHQRTTVSDLVSLLEVFDRKPLLACGELLTQLLESLGGPVCRLLEQNLDGADLGGVVLHEAGEGSQVLFRPVLLALTIADEPLAGDGVGLFLSDQKHLRGSLVVDEEILERLVAEQDHRLSKLILKSERQALGELAHVTSIDVCRELIASVTRHLLVDAVEPLH